MRRQPLTLQQPGASRTLVIDLLPPPVQKCLRQSGTAGVTAGAAQKFATPYAAPLIGFAIVFIAMRLVSMTFLPETKKLPWRDKLRVIEKQVPWLAPVIMLLLTIAVSPRFAKNPLHKNPAFWGGTLFGFFYGTTYKA